MEMALHYRGLTDGIYRYYIRGANIGTDFIRFLWLYSLALLSLIFPELQAG